MRTVIAAAVAVAALGGARLARTAAEDQRSKDGAASETPFAPSERAAPFLSLGYREVAADLLYVRMLGYFMSEESVGAGVADLAEAITTLDPHLTRAYDTGANAMTLAKHVDQSTFLRAIALLERGMKVYPNDWRLPYLAGQIYTQDLTTQDRQQQRAWDERGTLLVESAIRKPGAPTAVATWAASMRTKLGQHERAVAGLRELLLVTSPGKTRERLIAALAELEKKDSSTVAAEILDDRNRFERRWKQERPLLPTKYYILLGPRPTPGFDMADLATGGRDLLQAEPASVDLEPLE